MAGWWSSRELRVILGCTMAAGVLSGIVWWSRHERALKSQGALPARLDLNRATVAQLEALPGMTARQAASIVAYRRRQGPFRRVADLLDVNGIEAQHVEHWAPFLKTAPTND